MKNKIAAAALILLSVISSGCSSANKLAVSEVTSAPVIDANLSEWKTETFSSFDEGRIKLGYYSDPSYYYFAAVITDKELCRQVAFNGLKIWIDPAGQKNKDLEMRLMLRDMKRIDNSKGGFFAELNTHQKSEFIKSMDSLKQGVVVYDRKNGVSENFLPGVNASFEGKIFIRLDALSLEMKIPVDINKYFQSYGMLDKRKAIFGVASAQGGFVRDNDAGTAKVAPGGGDMPDGSMSGRNNSGRDKDMQAARSRAEGDREIWFSIDDK
ncbi:MAG: hypothetical protein ACM3SM_03950 [Bacteroidota bacterium]